MNTIKCLSLLIASSLLSTAVLAQNAKPAVAAEIDLKPVVAKPITNNVPAPGTRIVAAEPIDAIKPTQPQMKPLTQAIPADAMVAPSPKLVSDDKMEEAKALIVIDDANQRQAKMTEEMKAKMAGKSVRPKTINQTTGETEAKLTPATLTPAIQAKLVVAPVVEN